MKNTEDGFLAEFPSAVEAVRAALRFQSRIHEFAAADPEHGRVAFRIGVNIGDIIVEPHDIFGEASISLRVLKASQRRAASASRYLSTIKSKERLMSMSSILGEQVLKNISRPVRAFAVATGGSFSTTVTSPDIARHSSSPSFCGRASIRQSQRRPRARLFRRRGLPRQQLDRPPPLAFQIWP
ncbi:class 3 adenylate cyclase [Bradyrhizobium elkanii]